MKELLSNRIEMGMAVEDSLYSSDNNMQCESHPISRINQEEDYYNDV